MNLRSFVSSFIVGDSSVFPDTPIYVYLWPLEHAPTTFTRLKISPRICEHSFVPYTYRHTAVSFSNIFH